MECTAMGSTDNFCLRWNDFPLHISSSLKDIRGDEEFFDITLCCDNGIDVVRAHKVILAACSPLFRKILARQSSHVQQPFLYLKGIQLRELEAVLNFMYHGEVSVGQDCLNSFLATAEELAVKGLTSDDKSSSDSKRKRKKASNSSFQDDQSSKKSKDEEAAEIDVEDCVLNVKAEPSAVANKDDASVGQEEYEIFDENGTFDNYAENPADIEAFDESLAANPSPFSAADKPDWSFACDLCPPPAFVGINPTSVKNHYRREHPHDVERLVGVLRRMVGVHSCKHCDYMGTTVQSYRKHMSRTHRELTARKPPYKCSLCDFHGPTYLAIRQHKESQHPSEFPPQ